MPPRREEGVPKGDGSPRPRARGERAGGGGGVTARLLPFDCVADYLDSHPLVQGLGLHVPDLHTALLLDERVEATARANERASTEAAHRRSDPRQRCIDCNAPDVVLSTTDGVYVCDACGVVQSRRTINVTPEYVAPAVLPARKRPRTIPGVPTWMVRSMHSDEDRPQNHMEDLEHLNHYVRLSHEQLEECNVTLNRWTGGRFSPNVRLVAVLLHPRIRDQFLDGNSVRRSLQTMRRTCDEQTLAVVSDPDAPASIRVPHVRVQTAHRARGAGFTACAPRLSSIVGSGET